MPDRAGPATLGVVAHLRWLNRRALQAELTAITETPFFHRYSRVRAEEREILVHFDAVPEHVLAPVTAAERNDFVARLRRTLADTSFPVTGSAT
ncbi:MAG: hypothetical protein A3K19_30210 [Lentisphaerae bacterium RIFOXYB12_FULL_65_16]|nr:MAG: hypothetical protein A3K18_29575 [Lentisphaerae bacterium RIFOXYA12_64_32]OGV85848.1 MAG: hypothetical protein A3K19_30210 [Lentisphaerae bacterium RIFOXYB12_FULL_65_16]